MPRGGTLVQYSSHSSSPGAVDSWEVPPGKTVTLVDHRGPGIVRRWWMTLLQHQKSPDLFRNAIIRCYWDDETDPSVEAPVSDFFGLSFGEWQDYVSIPASATSGGFNCYWPMPFWSRGRITLENRSTVPITGLYFNIGVESVSRLAKEALYFHAQFRRAAPTTRGKPVTVLEATGSGQFVGTVLSARTLRGIGMRFLEGDEAFYVDGEKSPSVSGTGTEDYFSSGLYFVTGTFSGPYHGVTKIDREKNRVGAYRWHIEDPVPFRKSIRLELEHGPNNDVPADYATLAIWYQDHPHAAFPALPDSLGSMEALPPFAIAGLHEAESLIGTAHATRGQLQTQSMAEFIGDWSGDAQLLWRGARSGDHLTLFLMAPDAGEYELLGYFSNAPDYGDVTVSLQGRVLALVRGYHEALRATGSVSLGRVKLERGANAILLEVMDKDPRATDTVIGIDGFQLKMVPISR
jgi:D-arabinan exo alpha-(1,3)/(1,5)-arabinofuranosidase (non-reducing end)